LSVLIEPSCWSGILPPLQADVGDFECVIFRSFFHRALCTLLFSTLQLPLASIEERNALVLGLVTSVCVRFRCDVLEIVKVQVEELSHLNASDRLASELKQNCWT
jgi:hypothetical protein